MKIALVQPRYPHGGRSRVYLPGGLMNLGSRLLAECCEVSLCDRNLDPLPAPRLRGQEAGLPSHESFDTVGFSVLGPPYIPTVIADVRELRKHGFGGRILIGGEGVARVNGADFDAWFAGLSCTRIASDEDLRRACGLSRLASMYESGMEAMLEALPEERQRAYLAQEFCLFLAQGCQFTCRFCAAQKGKAELYRSEAALVAELEYITTALSWWGERRLRCYLSNLDIFQTPLELEKRLRLISEICRSRGITPELRGLATSRCTTRALRADRHLASRLRACGLVTVGFGADGADEEVWRRENKNHNSLSELGEAVVGMQSADITPELLMVIGFEADRARSLWRDLRFSLEWARKKAVIRPYLGKSQTPSGNWVAESELARRTREQPELLANLDYAMLGSTLTHPRTLQRTMANALYLFIIALLSPLGLCPTRPLVPVGKSRLGRILAHAINRVMPCDN